MCTFLAVWYSPLQHEARPAGATSYACARSPSAPFALASANPHCYGRGMTGSRFWFVGALLVLGIGCSSEDDADPPAAAQGGAGESCTKRADCLSGLMCLNLTCQPSVEGQIVKDPDLLGGEGESCSRAQDCGAGLLCVSNVCAESSGAIVGGEGETCGARSDCAEGLGCWANVCARHGAGGAGGSP
jgi:hypothetical protein